MFILPMLQPLLAMAGVPEITPIVQLVVKVLESLHLFC